MSVVFVNTNNELSQREMKKAIPFIIVSKRIKYLRINLNKEMKDLCPDNEETEDTTNKWKDTLHSWV